ATAIVEDLRRRMRKGTFGKEPGRRPEDFADWDDKKRIEFLIEALDEADVRQRVQPLGGNLMASERRVRELIAFGDVAAPALIDTIEKDSRLTRAAQFPRDFIRMRTVLGVREGALMAVMSILRVRNFWGNGAGNSFTARGEEDAKRTAAQLRVYWKKYGNL